MDRWIDVYVVVSVEERGCSEIYEHEMTSAVVLLAIEYMDGWMDGCVIGCVEEKEYYKSLLFKYSLQIIVQLCW